MPDWSVQSHSLAYSVACQNHNLRFYMILNAYWESLEFELPSARDGNDFWRRWIAVTVGRNDRAGIRGERNTGLRQYGRRL
jgi:hypothetical protein